MSFFNSKEEVLDIELTQYGKLLLSRGMLKPAYFSFHDEDILYDVGYADLTENTNFAEVRIQEETPVLKPFYSFFSPKPFLSKDIEQESFNAQRANLSIQKTGLSPNTISNSTISNLYIPSWEIYNLSSNFTSSATTFDNNNVVNAAIPQFNVVMNSYFYKTNQEQIDDNPALQNIFSNTEITFKDDDIYMTVINPILLKIVENNVDFENDAFDFELYKVSKDEEDNDVYTQLKFLKEIENYDSINDLYIKASNAINNENDIDSMYGDYYLDILCDKEISSMNVCKYILKSSEDLDLIFNDIAICDSLRDKMVTDDLYNLPDTATGKTC